VEIVGVDGADFREVGEEKGELEMLAMVVSLCMATGVSK